LTPLLTILICTHNRADLLDRVLASLNAAKRPTMPVQILVTANACTDGTEIYRRMIHAGMKVRWVPEAVIYHRIESPKLRKSYFLDLHYRQGRMEGHRRRGAAGRLPPLSLLPQLWRAFSAAAECRLRQGGDQSLRLEMYVAYFVGFILGWSFN